MTVLEFRSNPTFHTRLKAMLEDPIFKLARELVEESLRPRMGRATTIEQAGLIGAYSAGGYRTLETLDALAEEAPKKPEPVPEYDGWAGAHLQSPEELDAAFRARQQQAAP